MKLSFTTLGCPAWSFAKILDEARKMGFDGIEVRGVNGVMRAEEIEMFSPESAEETKAQLRAHGLEAIGFGTSASFHDEARYEGAIDEGRKAIDVCHRMGFPFIRVFGDRIAAPGEREAVIGRVVSGMGELCDYAEGKNVQVLLEVHGEFNTVENVRPIIDALGGKEAFGILWDIEHSDKVYGDDWLVFYRAIQPHILHTHIKDYHRKADGGFELCLVGEGDIPIVDIVKQLRADGYDGYYSLEWEKKWVPALEEPEVALPAYKAYMEKIVQD